MRKTNQHTLPIPDRKEFHKSFAGYVTELDFYTNRCIPGSHVNKIASALHLDKTLAAQTEVTRRMQLNG